MIVRSRVRRAPKSKKRSKVTGLVYLFGYRFAGKTVAVMDIDHYRSLRRRIVDLQGRLYKIKRMAGSVNVKPVR